MLVTQVFEFVNVAQKEVLGESAITLEDLSNIVDVGKALEDLDDGYENFYKAMANRIGRMLFESRTYEGKYKKLYRDSWEFGSIMGKVQAELLEATENESYQIINGASYDPYVVNLPVITSKFYNKAVTLEIDVTTPVDQIKQSFKSADEMVKFASMLEVMVNNSMEVKLEILASRAVNNLIGATVSSGGARVINLVTEWNTSMGTTLNAVTALLDKDFLNYAVSRLLEVKGYLEDYTKLYNLGEKARFTKGDRLAVEINSTFASRVKTRLASNTYHDDLVSLPNYEEVSYWQGVGTDGGISSRMSIQATIVDEDGETQDVTASNVVCAMFDIDACGIVQPQKKITTAYNAKAEYYNSFHKWLARYFNDFNQQAVVFTLN